MTTATIAQLVVELSANVGKYSNDIQAAARVTQSTMDQIKSSAETAKRALTALGVSLSVGAGVKFVKDAIDAADALNDLSQKTGITVEKLGGLGYAAKTAGTNLEGVAVGVRKLEVNMTEAAGGGEAAARMFQQLGVSIKGTDGTLKTADETLFALADQFASFEDGPAKAAAAVKVFGKTGTDMIPLLNMGGDALRAMIADYEKYGGITADTAARADQFNDTMGKLNMMGGALSRTIAAALLPTLQAIADILVDAKSKGGGFAAVGEGIAVVLKSVAIAGMYAWETLRSIGTSIGAVAAIVASALGGDFKGAAEINRQANEDLRRNWQDTARNVEKVWTASAATIGAKTEEMGKRVKAPILDAAGAVNEFAKAAEAAAKMAATTQLDFAKLFDDKPITEAEKALAQMIASGVWAKLTQEQRLYIAEGYNAIAVDQKRIKTFTELAAAAAAFAKQQADERKAFKQQVEDEKLAAQEFVNSYAIRNDVLERENALVGADELSHRLLAAALEYEAEKRRLGVNVAEETLRQLDAEYEKRQRLIADGFGREQAVAYEREWLRSLESVSRGLGDFFVDLVNNGSSAFKRLWESFKNWALQAMAQIAAKQVVVNLVGATSVAGAGGASASPLGGLGDIVNVGSSIYSAFSGGFMGGAGTGGLLASGGFGAAQSVALDSMLLNAGGGLAELAGGAFTAAMGPLIAAVPWIALAAIAIPMIVKMFEDGPAMRTGNWFQGALNSQNTVWRGKSAFGTFGVGQDQWFGNDMDSAARQFIASIEQMDNSIAAAVGPALTEKIAAALAATPAAALSFGMEHTDFNESGVAGSILKARYETVLGVLDQRLADVFSGFQGAGDAMGQFILGLIQLHAITTTLPTEIEDGLIAALDATSERLAQVTALAQAYATVQAAMNADPMADVAAALAGQTDSIRQAFQNAGAALQQLIATFDGSANAAQSLTAATQQYYAAEVQLLGALERAKSAVAETYGGLARSLTLDTLSGADKYAFYQQEIEMLQAKLLASTSAEEIQRLSQQIATDFQAAFGLLSPEQQKAGLDEYLKAAATLDEQAQTRLRELQDQVQKDASDTLNQIRQVLTDAIGTLKEPAALMDRAANAQINAANKQDQAADKQLRAASAQEINA